MSDIVGGSDVQLPLGMCRSLGLGLAITTHEHALVEQALEGAERSGLVQATFVATHAGSCVTRPSEG